MNDINFWSNCVTHILENYLKFVIRKINLFYNQLKINIMNLKRIFGALLTALGIGGLIYTAIVFSSTSGETRDVKELIIYGVLGIVFFTSGISLVRTTKDES